MAIKDFPAKCIWKSTAPIKAGVFALVANEGKFPTEDMLKRRWSWQSK